jgi:SAUR family protein
MDIACKKSQSTTNLRKMVHIATRPKKILQLWLWWAPQYYRENPKESLLVGSKFSTGGKLVANGASAPEKVPRGFLAVYVGAEQRRFVIPLSCLSTPEFVGLMDKVAEEFGYDSQEGGLHFPCEEEYFEEILLRCLRLQRDKASSKSRIKRSSTSYARLESKVKSACMRDLYVHVIGRQQISP